MKLLLLPLAFTALFLAPLSAATVTVSAGTIAIPIEDIMLQTHYDIISSAPDYGLDESGLRGYSTTAALLLNGLAQTCMQVGNAIGTATANRFAQGVFQTLGISLATAAAIVTDRKQQREQKKANDAQLSKALMTIMLHEDAVVEAIKMRAGVTFTDWLTMQSLSTEPTAIPFEQSNAGLMLYTPSETFDELPQIITNVAENVTSKLLIIYTAILNQAA